MNDSAQNFSTGTAPPLPMWARASLIYLLLPLAVFAAGWLKPWIAAVLLVLISASALTMIRGCGSLPRFSSDRLRATALIALLALVFSLLSGTWPGLPQSNDHIKHFLILGDLIEKPWPVRYPGENGGEYLCYGLGYYMIPAVIARFCGTACAGIANFAWAGTGVFLFFLGLARLFPRHPATGILLVVFCSGLGTFWYLIKGGFVHSLLPTGTIPNLPDFINTGLFSNIDSFTRMFYQPQHGLAGWLGGLLIHEFLVVRKQWAESAVVLAATCFWSPVTAAGLGAVGLTVLFAAHRTLVFRPMIHLAAALAIMGALAAYYLPHLPIAEKGFIWDLSGKSPWFFWYFLFVFLFVLIPAAAVFWLDWKQPYLDSLRPVVVGMVILLAASPLYKLGYYGDLRLQVSGPAFLFLAIAMSRGLLQGFSGRRTIPFFFLCAVFLGGAMAPLIRTYQNIIVGSKTDLRIEALRSNQLNSIKDLRMPGFDVTSQYLGRAGAPSALRLLKSPHPDPRDK